MTLLYFILALSILVLVHEWGHYYVAKKSGMRVDTFSIGMGPKLFGFKWDGTEFIVSLFPLGGYVKIFGQDPEGEAEGDPEKAKAIATAPDSFHSKSYAKRMAVVFAGPFMNFVLAFILMPLALVQGRKEPAILYKSPVVLGVKEDSPAIKSGFQKGDMILSIDNKKTETWDEVLEWVVKAPNNKGIFLVERSGSIISLNLETSTPPAKDSKSILGSKNNSGYAGFEPFYFYETEPIIGEVQKGLPASKAGLMPKDRILSVNGNLIGKWEEMTDLVQKSEGKPIEMIVQRGEETVTSTVNPEKQGELYIVGIVKFQEMVVKKYSLTQAFTQGSKEVIGMTGMIGQVLKSLITGKLGLNTLGGPLQIAQQTGEAAKKGLSDFIILLVFLSVQLGVLNLLPIPVVDGGHIFFMTIEKIAGKQFPAKIRNAITIAGLVVLLTFFIVVSIKDIDRVWNFNLIDKIKSLF